MDSLNLAGGMVIEMRHIVCITYGNNIIDLVHINPFTNELVVSEWTTRYSCNFIQEVNRLQQTFLEYLNRKGIPHED